MEFVSRKIVSLSLFIFVLCETSKAVTDFENGRFYIINSVGSGKAMTLSPGGSGTNALKGPAVVTSPWIARDTQTWLALAESSTKEGKAVGGPQKFVLIPQKQTWDWKEYVHNGEVNLTLETLPPYTMVLTLDSTAVNLTQEIYADESSQKWVTEDVANGEVLIKNWGNQQCIRNFDYKIMNFLETLRRRIDNIFGVFRKRKPSPLGTLTCDSEDLSERWTIEPAYVLNFRRL